VIGKYVRFTLRIDSTENSRWDISLRVDAAPNTVGKWRCRFAEHRLDGLLHEPRPGAPRRIGDDEVAKTIRLTLDTTPRGATHWSLRSMAKRGRICALDHPSHLEGVQPSAALPRDLQAFRRPIVCRQGARHRRALSGPPERALVLWVDEKSQIQALDRSQPLLPMRPGQIERRSHNSTRHGTLSLFAALDAATGKVIGRSIPAIAAASFSPSRARSKATSHPISTFT
jgi:hypothetical protein